MEKLSKILLISEVIVLAALIFIYFDFSHQNSTRYDYGSFMEIVANIIIKYHLNVNIQYEFDLVFKDKEEIETIGKGLFVSITKIQIILGLVSICGVIFDIVFQLKNKKQYVSIFCFSFALLVGIIELVNTTNYENPTNLNLSDEQLESFKEIRDSIDENVSLVKKRVTLLITYSSILFVASFYLLLLTIYFNRDIITSDDNKVEILESSGEEKPNNFPLEKDLINNKNGSE